MFELFAAPAFLQFAGAGFELVEDDLFLAAHGFRGEG